MARLITQTFTASSTSWTAPAEITQITVFGYGGGSGGGGAGGSGGSGKIVISYVE